MKRGHIYAPDYGDHGSQWRWTEGALWFTDGELATTEPVKLHEAISLAWVEYDKETRRAEAQSGMTRELPPGWEIRHGRMYAPGHVAAGWHWSADDESWYPDGNYDCPSGHVTREQAIAKAWAEHRAEVQP